MHIAVAIKAKPNYALTLTCNPNLHNDPQAAYRDLAYKKQLIVRWCRKHVEGGEFEYMSTVETTKAGWPHIHMLVRGGWLPLKALHRFVKELTGASQFKYDQLDEPQKAAAYVAKYITKTEKQDFARRRVQLSRAFKTPAMREAELAHRSGEKRHFQNFTIDFGVAVLQRDGWTVETVAGRAVCNHGLQNTTRAGPASHWRGFTSQDERGQRATH